MEKYRVSRVFLNTFVHFQAKLNVRLAFKVIEDMLRHFIVAKLGCFAIASMTYAKAQQTAANGRPL